jgi:hypothetical protein
MARKVDEAANFVFLQLTEQEPGIMTNVTQTMLGKAVRVRNQLCTTP